MLTLYYWPTPNGHKVTIFLEEAKLDYEIRPVDIRNGEQLAPSFLAVSPNNKIPALTDSDPPDGEGPISLFESGAILMYLAEKTGRFLPKDPVGSAEALQWLFWQVAGLGPMLGQNHHFVQFAPKAIPYAIDRYVNETNRLYGVLDRRLNDSEFVAGSEFSVVDMAVYPWIVPWKKQRQRLDDFPNVKRWFDSVRARPGVTAAYAKGEVIR